MDRFDSIHAKGFDISQKRDEFIDYSKLKIGAKNLEDAVLNLGSLRRAYPRHPFTDKNTVLKALMEKDLPTLRAISDFFYVTSGIYERACNYFAFLYRYDWYVTPEIYDESVKDEKVLKDFSKILTFFDNSYIKKICGEIALEIVKHGCYYGYLVPNNDGIILQQLPIEYCRSHWTVNGLPAVEFNMRFFDSFSSIENRMKILNTFPDDFKKGYMLYKSGKLKRSFTGDQDGWYLLDPNAAIKFNFNGSDIPIFVNAIPQLLDLDAAQDLDRRKQMQKLLKIIVQKLPMDKNGDLIFDVDEARDIHNNAVEMLKRAVGVDVLTTFADVDSIDMSDTATSSSQDDLNKIERQLFNALGLSQNLFNSESTFSLEKSILNDESSMRNLLFSFTIFFDKIAQMKSTNRKKYSFRFYLLETTQHNYKDMAKMYKEQTQIGFSKMLPQIALGHSQSFILNTAVFENEVLSLTQIMIPPLMSSTLSSEDIQTLGKGQKLGDANSQDNSEGQVGRPEKSDDEKSEKTILNKESM